MSRCQESVHVPDPRIIANNLMSLCVFDLRRHSKYDICNCTLRIKALCQVLSNICLADWNIEANILTYYRVPEELPLRTHDKLINESTAGADASVEALKL